MESAVTSVGEAPRTSHLHRRVLIAYAITSPLLLATFTQEWLLTQTWYIDPWHYVGFFLNYTEPRYSDDAYKLARLPWILPGALTYSIVPYSLAPYLLHIGSLVALTAGFYLLVNELFRSVTIAALSAMLIGFYTHVHGSGGWDYHNAAAGPYYVWALYLATVTARAPTPRMLFLGGCFAALAVHANITLINLMPILAIHWVVLRRQWIAAPPLIGRELWHWGLWTAAGGVGVTAVLMALNVAVGRGPLFFKPLVEIVLRYTADPSYQAAWWRPWTSGWVLDARHLALGWAVLMAVCAILVSPRAMRRLLLPHRLALLEFAALCAVWALWQSTGQTALDWDYFAYPLYAHAILALTALIHAQVPPTPWPVLIATPLMLALPLAFWFDGRLQGLAPGAYAFGTAVPGVAMYLMALGALWGPARVRMVVFTILFACANGVSAAQPATYATANRCRVAADFHSSLVETNRLIAALDPRFKDTNLWFQEHETISVGSNCTLKIADFGYAVGASGVPYMTKPFPMPRAEAIPAPVLEGVARSRIKVLVVSGRPESEAALKRRFDELGIHYTVIARRRFPVLDGTFDVTVADVQLQNPTADDRAFDSSSRPH